MTLAARLLLLIGLALLPPLLLGIWNDASQRHARETMLRASALSESRSVESNVARIASGVRGMLAAVAEAPILRSQNAAECTRYLESVTRQLAVYTLLAATDRTGMLICNSAGNKPGAYSNAERAYLTRALRTDGFAAGDLVVGTVTRRPSLHFALPFRGYDGNPGGIVVASVDQDWLTRQLANEVMPRGAVALLLDPSGTVAAAFDNADPNVEGWTGRKLPDGLRGRLTVSTPTVIEAPGPDGKLRLFGALPPNPDLAGLTAVVGLDRERAFADISRESWQTLLGLALGGAVALVAGILSARRFIMRPLGQLAAAAARVGAGDLSARADLGRRSSDLQGLGAVFDHMAEALATRERERGENEAALRESEARFQSLVDCIDQIVWSTRPDGFHDYFNQRWYEFTGTSPGTGDGETWRGLFHPDDQAIINERWSRSLQTGEPYRIEYRLRHVSGQFRWVLGRAQPVRDPAGRIVRWYGTCTEIDEIVQAREVLARSREMLAQEVSERTAELVAAGEQLRQLQKMEAVGQLTGGIAHDFNNMLQAIGGSLELLVRRVDQGRVDDAKRFAEIARKTVERASSLTHRLLAFARRQALQPEPLAPETLVDGMAELISRTAGAAIEFSIRRGDGIWTVLCDRSQLENVLLNLCLNARDAMPQGGKLSIGIDNATVGPMHVADGALPGDYVEIAVADTGAGMDDATLARAFEPFFTTKPVGQGTGLGLSQVYGFVRQSGGFVRIDSVPGTGTTVRLFLPRHDPAAAAAAGADRRTGRTILFVESDEALAEAAALHLRGLGFEVLTAKDGAEALQWLTTGPKKLDLLVTAVGLAGPLNGRQVAETVRARQRDVKVLFMTGFAASRMDGPLEPGMAVIDKPFTPEGLGRFVREALQSEAV